MTLSRSSRWEIREINGLIINAGGYTYWKYLYIWHPRRQRYARGGELQRPLQMHQNVRHKHAPFVLLWIQTRSTEGMVGSSRNSAPYFFCLDHCTRHVRHVRMGIINADLRCQRPSWIAPCGRGWGATSWASRFPSSWRHCTRMGRWVSNSINYASDWKWHTHRGFFSLVMPFLAGVFFLDESFFAALAIVFNSGGVERNRSVCRNSFLAWEITAHSTKSSLKIAFATER